MFSPVMNRMHVLTEMASRVALWIFFHWLDESEPFIRVIKPEELWKYQYPVHHSYVTSTCLWFIIILTPLAFLLGEYFIQNQEEDALLAGWALTLLYPINGVVTSFIKILVGRPRPDFYYRCFPKGSGEDFTKCNGLHRDIMDGRKSFPSGHSSFAFSGAVFMTLYIARKIKLEKEGRQSWKLCVCLVPLLIASAIAISRTCDYHHHYEDVIAGGLLGSSLAYLVFKLYFPASEEVKQ